MTDLDQYLTSTELLDCEGRVRHRLTLLLDGKVRIAIPGRTVVVDMETGLVDPPTVQLSDAVMHAAAELSGRPMPKRDHDHRSSWT